MRLNEINWQLEMTCWMFLLTEGNAQAFSSMFGERSFLNLFRDM